MAIGTTALLAGAAGIGSSLIGASAANKAADAQTDAADAQIKLNKQIYRDQKGLFSPFRDAGLQALQAYNYEMGLGPAPMVGGTTPQVEKYAMNPQADTGWNAPWAPRSGQQGGFRPPYDKGGSQFGGEGPFTGGPIAAVEPQYGFRVGDKTFATRRDAEAYAAANPSGGTAYQGFQETPGYQFQFDQGQRAIDGSAASSGGLFSGETLRAQAAFGQGLANQEYNNWLNRLSGMAGSGQAAAGMQATAAGNMGQASGNALASIGNAQSAGAIGTANAVTGGISNALSTYGYMTNMNNPHNPSNYNATPGQGVW